MAQTRVVSILAKQEKMETILWQAEKQIIVLRKIISKMRKSQVGPIKDLADYKLSQKSINAMLLTCQQADNLILELQNMINQTASYSIYLQSQLMLEAD